MKQFFYKNTKAGVRVFGEDGVDYTFYCNPYDAWCNTPFRFRMKTAGTNTKWGRLTQEEFDKLVSMLLDKKAIKRFEKFGRA